MNDRDRTKKSLFKDIEILARETALNHAIYTQEGQGDEEIIKSAQKYYEFLVNACDPKS